METQAEILLELSLGLLGAGDSDYEIIGHDPTVLLDLDFDFGPAAPCDNCEILEAIRMQKRVTISTIRTEEQQIRTLGQVQFAVIAEGHGTVHNNLILLHVKVEDFQ